MSCRRPGLSSLLLVACPDGDDRDAGAATRGTGVTTAAMADPSPGPGVTATGDVPTTAPPDDTVGVDPSATASPHPWALTPPSPSPG